MSCCSACDKGKPCCSLATRKSGLNDNPNDAGGGTHSWDEDIVPSPEPSGGQIVVGKDKYGKILYASAWMLALGAAASFGLGWYLGKLRAP